VSFLQFMSMLPLQVMRRLTEWLSLPHLMISEAPLGEDAETKNSDNIIFAGQIDII